MVVLKKGTEGGRGESFQSFERSIDPGGDVQAYTQTQRGGDEAAMGGGGLYTLSPKGGGLHPAKVNRPRTWMWGEVKKSRKVQEEQYSSLCETNSRG